MFRFKYYFLVPLQWKMIASASATIGQAIILFALATIFPLTRLIERIRPSFCQFFLC